MSEPWYTGRADRLSDFDEEDRVDFEEIQIGDSAREFFNSKYGKLVIARNMVDWREARNALEHVDATDTAAVQKLQLQARVARGIIKQLAEAIDHGERAEERQRAKDDIAAEDEA